MVRQRVALPAVLLALAASANAAIYKGCYSSSTPLADQGSYDYQASGYCAPICAKMSSGVMAFSAGTHCWCGDQLPATSSLVDDSKCNLNCTGFPSEMCGGAGYWTVYLTGIKSDVTNYAVESPSSSSSSSSASSSSSGSSTVTSTGSGSTVVVTVSASSSSGTNSGSGGGTSTAGVAAGAVVGIVAVAGVIGGVYFWLRHRRRRSAEEDYKRSAQVSDFMRGANERKIPNTGYSQMSDSRLDPEAGRRNSVGSMADEHDYSRRILRVANPDR